MLEHTLIVNNIIFLILLHCVNIHHISFMHSPVDRHFHHSQFWLLRIMLLVPLLSLFQFRMMETPFQVGRARTQGSVSSQERAGCRHFSFLASFVEEAKFQVNTAEKSGALFFMLPLIHRTVALTLNTGVDKEGHGGWYFLG